MSETVTACPECDTPAVSPVTGGHRSHGETDYAYYCKRCGATFDEPVERAPHQTPALNGLAKTLAETDADDLVTDGGSRACIECGATGRGAFLLELDGDVYCEDCASPQPCERCGQKTEETTLSGAFRCRECQEHARQQETSREVGQGSLDSFVTDGGTDAPHYCDICDTTHETLASLIRHECSPTAVTDGGALVHHYAEYECGNRYAFVEGEEHAVPTTCPNDDCEADVAEVIVDE